MPGLSFYLPQDLYVKVLQEPPGTRAKLIQKVLRDYYKRHEPGELKIKD